MRNNQIFGHRAGAYILDLLAIYVLAVATMFVMVAAYGLWHYAGDETMMKDLLSSPSTRLFVQVSHAVLYFAYFTIAHWYFGRTLGKWAFGLEVRHQGRAELGFLRSLGRSASYVLSGQLTLAVGFLLPLFRQDGRTLHDIIMDTDVVRSGQARESEIPVAEEGRRAA